MTVVITYFDAFSLPKSLILFSILAVYIYVHKNLNAPFWPLFTDNLKLPCCMSSLACCLHQLGCKRARRRQHFSVQTAAQGGWVALGWLAWECKIFINWLTADAHTLAPSFSLTHWNPGVRQAERLTAEAQTAWYVLAAPCWPHTLKSGRGSGSCS